MHPLDDDPEPDDRPVLKLTGLRLGYPEQRLFSALDMRFVAPSLSCLLGPSGSGKSTLLRVLAGYRDVFPTLEVVGGADLDGDDLLAEGGPGAAPPLVLLPQRARLYDGSLADNLIPFTGEDGALDAIARAGLESALAHRLDDPVMSMPMELHRMIVLCRQLTERTRFILMDEPCRDISISAETRMRDWVRGLARRYGVILVTHDKAAARELADRVVLLSGGRVVADASAEDFFSAPPDSAVGRFLQSGSCWLPDAGGNESAALDEVAPPRGSSEGSTTQTALPGKPEPGFEASVGALVDTAGKEEATLPYEFHWVQPRRLGGCQRPGLVGTVASDMRGLAGMGVRHLVTLTQRPLGGDDAACAGINNIHFPIIDMGTPDLAAAHALCCSLQEPLDAGEAVVFHCRAGLGRTGTMLALMLVTQGAPAAAAIERVRVINPGYIQSDEQFRYVSEFERHIRA
ncbi:MAG: ATP-binding cassette domain-containing protein [Gammaproteobacteria bacterium]